MTGLATADQRPNLHYDLINPATNIKYDTPPKGWRFDKSGMQKRIEEKRIIWPSSPDGRPRQKLFLKDISDSFKSISSLILDTSTSQGTKEVNSLMGPGVFDFPKPSNLTKIFVEQATLSDDLILDFFSGSATTVTSGDFPGCALQVPNGSLDHTASSLWLRPRSVSPAIP